MGSLDFDFPLNWTESRRLFQSSYNKWTRKLAQLRLVARQPPSTPESSQIAKHYDDARRKPTFFEIGDEVFIRLSENGYTLPMGLSRKYSPRRAGPFKVVERIGRSAYKLVLPDAWRVHPVISVDHLESSAPDIFDRRLEITAPVRLTDHKVQSIMAEKTTGNARQYLISFEQLGGLHNQWATI